MFWGQGDQVNRCVLGHGNVIVCDSLKSVFWGQGDQVNRCVLGHGNVIVRDSLKRRCEPVQQLANMSIHAANSCKPDCCATKFKQLNHTTHKPCSQRDRVWGP